MTNSYFSSILSIDVACSCTNSYRHVVLEETYMDSSED